MSGLRAKVELPLRPESAWAARRIVAGVFGAWQLQDVLEDSQLIVSELLGNAYQHAPGYDCVELELLCHASTVTIRVNDGSALRPMLRAAADDEATGRGLRIIQAVSSRWGVSDHEGGKQVWARSTGPGRAEMPRPTAVVGLDVGGTSINATVLDGRREFLVDRLVEIPSRVLDGPGPAVEALATAYEGILGLTGTARADVLAVGLDTPGPASATGVISSRGATNFNAPEWRGFDVRGALQDRLALPVVYTNDANAAALYAHHVHFGADAPARSSVSAIVGTGLGGGVVEAGRVVQGAAGMAGELGHVHIPLHGLLADDQPLPACNCGFVGDAESVASLSGIVKNLLPYWLGRYPDHELHAAGSAKAAAMRVRKLAEAGDEMSLKIFEQQAGAIGRLFTVAANFTDPHAYFLGGGVVETEPHFREWFLARVRESTLLRAEQEEVSRFALVPDRDMAGARGAAIAALDAALATG